MPLPRHSPSFHQMPSDFSFQFLSLSCRGVPLASPLQTPVCNRLITSSAIPHVYQSCSFVSLWDCMFRHVPSCVPYSCVYLPAYPPTCICQFTCKPPTYNKSFNRFTLPALTWVLPLLPALQLVTRKLARSIVRTIMVWVEYQSNSNYTMA